MQRFSRAKFFAAFLGMIGAALFLFLAWRWYDLNYGPDPIMRAVKQAEEEDYNAAMADTYGGKTPQETLQLYIAAVEKGDYALASRYFIGDNQKKELESFNGATKENVEKYLEFLKQVEPWRSSLDDDNFTMSTKTDLGASLFVRFRKYPNGIWKIIEI